MACIAAQSNDIFLTQVVVKELHLLHGPSCIALVVHNMWSCHCLPNRSTKKLELATVPGATWLELFCQIGHLPVSNDFFQSSLPTLNTAARHMHRSAQEVTIFPVHLWMQWLVLAVLAVLQAPLSTISTVQATEVWTRRTLAWFEMRVMQLDNMYME